MAIAIPPQLAKRLNEGIAHHEAGRLDRAEAIYRQLAAQAPRTAVIFDLLGRVAEQQGRLEDALKYLRQAVRLDPASVSIAVQLSSVLIAANRTAEAEAILRKLTVDQPRSFDAWNALGFVQKLLGQLDKAIASHRHAVEINPRFAEGWLHLGVTLMMTGENAEALDCQNRALALNPKFTEARFGRAQALHKLYRIKEAIADYDAVIRADPQNLDARSYRLFALQSLDALSPEQLWNEHRAYGAVVGRGPDRLPGYDYSPDRRLRVAVLSPDFRTHSCAYFIEPLLRGLDPAQFELYLYHDHFLQDAVSDRLKGIAAVWRNFVGQPALSFERAVREDRPDILIDLTGHVGNKIRLPSFAKRLAPVQISYLGYPDTTGVPTMDYRFTDEIADPVGDSDRRASEKLVRLAPVAWTYQAPTDSPPVAPPPCRTSGVITFGCFSNPTKFTDPMMSAWARILAAVPGSRLLIKGGDFEQPAICAEMNARLARNSVPVDRVELIPRTPGTVAHLALYARMDLALDTFPYTGTTTICEALWMGRPIVALRGHRHAERVAASLLTAVGKPEWVADSVDAYVDSAMHLAGAPDVLAAETASLRDRLLHSPLMDHAGQAARFGAALRQCWIERTAKFASVG